MTQIIIPFQDIFIECALSKKLKHPRVMEKVEVEARKDFQKERIVEEACRHELQHLKIVVWGNKIE